MSWRSFKQTIFLPTLCENPRISHIIICRPSLEKPNTGALVSFVDFFWTNVWSPIRDFDPFIFEGFSCHDVIFLGAGCCLPIFFCGAKINLPDLEIICRSTDPLLPALVEGLSLVHPVPVAKAPAVPVVAKISVLVTEVATVTASWLELRRTVRTMTGRVNRVYSGPKRWMPSPALPGCDDPGCPRGSCCLLLLLCPCSLCSLGLLGLWGLPWGPCFLSWNRLCGTRPS